MKRRRDLSRLLRRIALHQQARQNRERRIQPRPPAIELQLKERAVVLRGGGLNHLILRLVRLDDDLPRQCTASSAPGDLRQQLECPLPRAVVGQIQRHIRRNHAHQRHLREIQPLGNHLRADEQLCAPGAELIEQLCVTILAGGRVNIHADDVFLWEEFFQFFLDFLRPRAEIADVLAAAFRAGVRRQRGESAVVAVEFRLGLPAAHDVVGHGDIAVRAFDDITAASAADEAVVPAPIHQQHGLFAARDAVLECRDQLPGKYASVAVLHLLAHVHQRDLRHRAVADAGGHFKQHIIPAPCPGEGQDAGRSGGKQKRRVLIFASADGNFARVISRMTVGDARRFVLLIHDNQP